MSFLAPLFALGALAIIGPILFHLIRRTTREVTPFSTLMFLQPSPPRITKRSRLENLWLLLLRCLVLALLALAFARPFLPRAATTVPPPGTGKRSVILVDSSASMRREKLWDEARSKVDALVRTAAPADEIALLTFDRTIRTLLSFDDWKAQPPDQRAANAIQRLAAASPGWGSTQLDTALLQAVEMLDQPGAERVQYRKIVVISDLQEGARVDGLQGYQWPRGITVVLESLPAQHRQNASVHWVSEGDESERPADEAPLRLRVTNAAEAKREQFQLRWTNAGTADAVKPLDAYVPAGQSRIVRAQKPPAGATALTLTGDDTEFDNTLFVLPPQVVQVPLLFVGQDADADPRGSLYYLRRAFPKTARQSVEIVAHRDEQAVPAFRLEQAQLLVLGDMVDDSPLASARQFAHEGKIVVAPLTSAANAQTIARLLEIPALAAPEAVVKDYALLAEIDFQHPLFVAFADPRFSDFTKIHWWKYRRLDVAPLAGAKVLARFDSGDPAIVQTPLGKGSVIIFTSSWRPSDSQLALSSKFVPLLNALLEQSSNLPAQRAQYFVGDEVPLPGGPQPLTIRKPDGKEVAAPAGSKFAETDQPGIYAVTPGTLRFVVNLAPEESRTSPLPPERLTSFGVPVQTKASESPAQLAQRENHVQATEIENRQKLWRWLIVVVLGLLLLETHFAGKLSRTLAGSTAAQT